ncbi:MAG: YndJ family protein [Polyangiales bacterium]
MGPEVSPERVVPQGDHAHLADGFGARAAAAGALLWAVMLAAGVFRSAGEGLVALAVGCAVPLGVSVSARAMTAGAEDRALQRGLALAAPFGLVSFGVDVGALAGALAGVWLLATLAVALRGWQRLALRGPTPLAGLAVDLGHLYLPVGGAWLVASRGGFPVMGFYEPIVLYTAAHFHYAGFAAPVVLGLLGLSMFPQGVSAPGARGVPYRLAAVVVMAGVPLVAVGITVSRSLESPSAVILGAGMLVASWLLQREGLRRWRGVAGRVSGALLAFAGLSLVLSMGLAVAFALTGSAGRATPGGRISFTFMAQVHGAANALGFALCALVGFALRGPPPLDRGPRFARPRLFARGFVGVDFFDRVGAVDPSRGVSGQLDDLDAFARAGFDPARVDPPVRAFYEHTAAHALQAEAVWHAPFGAPAALFRRVARRLLGQLELPLRDEQGETVHTRLFALDAARDGRAGARGYVRFYGEGAAARANYVAAYAAVPGRGGTYLSCAFPLPFASLLGMLRFEQGDRPGGLALSSEARGDDAGMFLATPLGMVRLPLRERIEVWREGDALRASHRVWLLGRPCVSLAYALRRAAP